MIFNELQLCPRCNSEPRIIDRLFSVRIDCPNCYNSTNWHDTFEQATEEWNSIIPFKW